MKNLSLLLGLLISTATFAADTKIQTNRILLGPKNSTAKSLTFEMNQGAANPAVRTNATTGKLQFTNDGTTFKDIGSGGGGGGGTELLADNPGFESGITNNWTASTPATVVARTGTNALFDLTSARFTPTTTGQTYTSTAYATPVGIAGGQCLASIRYITAETTNLYNLNVLDGSNNVLGTTQLTSTPGSVSQNGYVAFTCPTAATTIKLQIASTGAAVFIDLDNAHLGSDTRLADVTQARLVGGILITGCAGNTTSSTIVDMTVSGTCVYTPFGQALAPTTNVIGVRFASLPPGEYKIEYEGQVGESVAAKSGYFRMWDGANYTRETSTIYYGSANGNQSGISHSINYGTTQSNVTFTTRSNVDSGGASNFNSGISVGIYRVYYIPSSTETALRVDQLGWHVNATTTNPNINLGTTAVNTASVLPSTGGLSLTNNPGLGVIPANISCSGTNPATGTTCSAGVPQAGISFTLPQAGDALACVSFTWAANTSSNNMGDGFQIAETSNTSDSTVLQAGKNILTANVSGANNILFPFRVCQPMNFASAGQKTIRMFYTQAVTGTVVSSLVTGNIQWEVYPITYTSGALPVFRGLVTSNSSGKERIERIQIAGSATTPTIVRQSGAWVNSVTRTNVGNYQLNIASGIFSGPPTCTAVCKDTIGTHATVPEFLVDNTATTAAVVCVDATNDVGSDADRQMICVGPQ